MFTLQIALTQNYDAKILEVWKCGLPENWFAASIANASPEFLCEAQVLMSGARGVDEATLAALPALRVVQHLGVGVEKLDLAACRRRAISVLRLYGTNASAVAEHSLLLMLAALRRLPLQDRAVRSGAWNRETFRSNALGLEGKRVGLVGMGAIGQTVARRLAGFDVQIVYASRSEVAPELAKALSLQRVSLDDLVSTCNVISMHCPLTPDTRGMIDARRINRMRHDVVLVNTARGELIDQAALEVALRERPAMSVGLDTLEREPPGLIEMLGCENAVFTPHSAASTLDCFKDVVVAACANLNAFLNGRQIASSNVVHDAR